MKSNMLGKSPFLRLINRIIFFYSKSIFSAIHFELDLFNMTGSKIRNKTALQLQLKSIINQHLVYIYIY